ncbi:hypothetical protein [Vitiosangium sp. GDMCC 1.1324]|uniref:hypothetical protein n=1 Tax=Vitiosangium sp. (strain GDMCC 1.1324) TaxID=2138576 RepID=UPI000D395C42|nr:hypothetical protein [Vitiosangium sp. GDMCC 1.1324]PTL83241.1 hypothetical protein DAT35_14715 [Vitiosangium sp. GDMCC 1.1324]
MSALPEALRPWAAHLSLFPEDLALSVGAHVARLAAALGPLRARNEMEGGELQGYDGLTRRGSPERLLMSEWLMALEAPDEFVRRAAFGEQAYLRPAYRQPQGGRRTVALLDAGPDQFGSPRIAHLALLVVLARRAEAAGAGFSWAVLQSSPQTVPFSSVDAAAIGRWLKAVSAEPPTQAQLSGWFEALELGHAPDDVWLVGGARLSRLPGTERLSRVAVDEVVAPGARRLSVEVRPASRPSRQVVLELPPAPQCVRLLRDPFGTAVAAPVLDSSASAVRALGFSADGLRLLLAHNDGSVAAQALPQSPRATTPRPKRFHLVRDEALLAVGWRRSGGLIAVTLCGRTLRVYGSLKGYHKGRFVPFPLPEGIAPPRMQWSPEERPLQAMTQSHMGREIVVLLDAAGVLYRLDGRESADRSVLPIAQGVTALAERNGSLFYVARHPPDSADEDGLQLGFWTPAKSWQRPMQMGGDGAAYFGHKKDMADGEAGPLMVRHQSVHWRVLYDLRYLDQEHRSPRSTDLSPPPRTWVVGLAPWLPGMVSWPGLVVLGQDQRGFSLLAQKGIAERLVDAPARVVTATLSHSQPLLAWLTETGEVGVWSFQHRALVFRSVPGGKR